MGKSALAIQLALQFDGEIVNADSRQVYRSMDIGTAKPSRSARAKVPHHLIDILQPDQEFNLALFLEMARRAVRDIHGRGRLPIVAGGTGQYVWALVEGWQVPRVPPSASLREELEVVAASRGSEALHQMLSEADPRAASRIDPRNVRRVVRALEVYRSTGVPTAAGQHLPEYRSLIIGLTMDRRALYSRIDRRVEEMMEAGLVGETRELMSMGYSSELPCMSSIGYREAALHLTGEITLEEASRRIKYGTHRLARRQYAWFRHQDPRVRWLEAGPDAHPHAVSMVEGFLT